MPPEPLSSRQERLLRIQKANIDAWDAKSAPELKNLDANMKKNTGFIKKCKTSLGADTLSQLLNEIKTLQLTKYLSEIVSAIVEGLSRCSSVSDISAAIEVISALHQRFKADFTPKLIILVFNQVFEAQKDTPAKLPIEQKDKDELARISKIKTYLRALYELYLVGLTWKIDTKEIALESVDNGFSLTSLPPSFAKIVKFPTKSSQQTLPSEYTIFYGVVNELLENDHFQHINIQIIAHFAKYFCKDFGIISLEENNTYESNVLVQNSYSRVITIEQVDLIKSILLKYWESGTKQLKDMNKMLAKMEKSNKESLYNKGTISDEKKLRSNKLSKLLELMKESMEAFSSFLGLQMIKLARESEDPIMEISFDKQTSTEKTTISGSHWVDEEERQFYTALIDLRAHVPPEYLGVKSDKKINSTEDEKKPAVEPENEPVKIDDDDDDDAQDYEEFIQNRKKLNLRENDDLLAFQEGSSTTEAGGSKDGLKESASSANRLSTLIAQFPGLVSRERADEAAIEYCFAASKLSHKRIINTLLDVPRKRQDLLPFYARFIATLNPYIPTIAEGVLAGIESEFRWLARKKSRNLLDIRLKNARYLCELTKFGISPQYLIARYCKWLTESFGVQDIEVLCLFIENCGRLLLANSESGPHFSQTLKTMMRKRNALNLDERTVMMIDNAYLQTYSNLTNNEQNQKREQTILEQYIRHLIYKTLSKKKYQYVFKQLRKLPWNKKFDLDDSEDVDSQLVHKTLLSCFSKPHKINFDNLPVLASLVGLLTKLYPWFGVMVVDSVIENIKLELENNVFENSRRRVAEIKYIGELYNSKVIDSAEVFEILYLLLNFCQLPDYTNFSARDIFYKDPSYALHNSEDFFIPKLVCDLLKTCKGHFDSSFEKANLEIFLEFFELYLFTLARPFPIEIQFTLDEIFQDFRPKSKLKDDFNQVIESINARIEVNQSLFIFKSSLASNQEKDLTNVLESSCLLTNGPGSSQSIRISAIAGTSSQKNVNLHLDDDNGPEELEGVDENDDNNDSSGEIDNDTENLDAELAGNFDELSLAHENDYISEYDNISDSGSELDTELNEKILNGNVFLEDSGTFNNSQESSKIVIDDDLNDNDYNRDINGGGGANGGSYNPDQEWRARRELEDFENELNSMISESLNVRKQEKMIPLDMAIPFQLRDRKQTLSIGETKSSAFPKLEPKPQQQQLAPQLKPTLLKSSKDEAKSGAETPSGSCITFSMLTGKKSKPQIKNILISESSELAVRTKAQQIAAQKEKDKLNKIVLNYADQEDLTRFVRPVNQSYKRNQIYGKGYYNSHKSSSTATIKGNINKLSLE